MLDILFKLKMVPVDRGLITVLPRALIRLDVFSPSQKRNPFIGRLRTRDPSDVLGGVVFVGSVN